MISVLEVKASSGVCGRLKAAGWELPLHQGCRSSRAEAGLGHLGNDLTRKLLRRRSGRIQVICLKEKITNYS